MRRELLAGCGNRRHKLLSHPEHPGWSGLVTLDADPLCRPDVLHDLCELPLPFGPDEFDEVHAYEVLEHTGQQGDYRFFFAQFSDFWRILKPGGLLFATTPSLSSRWLWGDPGHTRVIAPESLVFLSQAEYARQIGVTPMTDYRGVYSADLEPVLSRDDGQTFSFALRAVKPSRIDGTSR